MNENNKRKKILFASHSHWTSPYKVGNNQYAELFAKYNYEVGYISSSLSPLHFLFSKNKVNLTDKLKLCKNYGSKYLEGRLWAYNPFSIVTPFNKFPLNRVFIVNNWYKFTIPNIRKTLAKMGWLKVNVICIDEYQYHFLLEMVNHDLSILRITDNIVGFSERGKMYKEKERELIKKSDIVLVTSNNLFDYVKMFRKNDVYYIPNGVSLKNFDSSSIKFPKEFNDIRKPRAIYVGAIGEWFDLNLLEIAAKLLPKISFVIIGSASVNISYFKKIKNVYFLGTKKNSEIKNYLYYSNVGIIPFKRNLLTNSVSPIKLYEYMACGLPVVSKKLEELTCINSPALIALDHADFVEKIKVALKIKDKRQFLKFAKENTWEKRFSRILKIISNYSGTKDLT